MSRRAPVQREHGDVNRYNRGPDENDVPGKPCRCTLCRAANAARGTRRYRLQAYGQWRPFVDVAPVYEHLAALARIDIRPNRVAALSGVDVPTITRITKGITKKVRPATADALLGVPVSRDLLADYAPIDGAGTRRRLQALIALGWSRSKLADRAGLNRSNLSLLLRADGVRTDTARKVKALYEELESQGPPQASRSDRAAATQARREAAREDWPVPAGWDDDLLDLSEEDLAAELQRQAAEMDDEELQRCCNARYKLRENSPLVRAGVAEFYRRRSKRQKQQEGEATGSDVESAA